MKPGEIETQFPNIGANMQVGLYVYRLESREDDRTLRLTAVNPAGARIVGLSEAELVGKTLDENFPGLREKGIPQGIAEVVRTGCPRQWEDMVYNDHRISQVYLQVRAFPLTGSHVGVLFEDISGQIQVEEELKHSLKEKELLLREIHHRVKNNLAMVSSLLNIQSNYIKDKQAQAAFSESRKRIGSIAMVHEKLYRSSDLTHLEFSRYVRDLVNTLVKSYSISSSRLDIIIDIGDLYLDAEVSVPLGLIVTELVTNTLKYGFKEDQKLTLSIRLKTGDNHLCLTVEDNGVGIPVDLDWKNTESLGIQLVILLVAQLEGDIQLDRKNGTSFRIRFPKAEPAEMIKN